MYKNSFRVDPKILALPRSEIYGEPLQHLLSMLREGEEPRKAVYLFTNAFMSYYKDGKLREYDSEGDAEEIAWAEKAKYDEFRKEALRTIPGLIEQDIPEDRPVFYILRSRLRKELAALTDRTSSSQQQPTEKYKMTNLKNQLIRLGSENPELRDHLRPVLDYVTASHRDHYDWSKYDLELYEDYLAVRKSAENIASKLGYRSEVDIGVKKPHTESNGEPCLYVGSKNTKAADEVAREIEVQLDMRLKKARDYGGRGVVHTLYFKNHKVSSHLKTSGYVDLKDIIKVWKTWSEGSSVQDLAETLGWMDVKGTPQAVAEQIVDFLLNDPLFKGGLKEWKPGRETFVYWKDELDISPGARPLGRREDLVKGLMKLGPIKNIAKLIK